MAVAALTLSGLGASAIADPTTDASGASGAASGSTPTTQEAAQAITPLAAASPLSCSAGVFYSVSSGGQLYQVNSTATTPIGTAAAWVDDFNGLGIVKNGQGAYAYERSNNAQTAQMYSFNVSSGTWTKVGSAYDTTKAGQGLFSGALVAGAVDLKTGDYYFGGYQTTTDWRGNVTGQVFKIWKFTPTTQAFSYVGYLDTSPNTSIANGDMAFNSDGDLIIVRGDGTTTTSFSVTAANLAGGTGGKIARSASDPFDTTKNVNGFALDDAGKAYLGSSTTASSFDMPSWTNKLDSFGKGLSSSTDLGSCSSPATITIQKDIQGRFNDSDQFTISLKQGTTGLGTATTEGAENGVQDQIVGPQPTTRNTTLSFAETGDGETDLANYTSSYACTVDGKALVGQTSGTSGSVTIPTTGQKIVCTFTNTAKAKPGSLTWTKTDADGNALAGSEWRLTGPSPVTTSVTVTDNTGQTGYPGLDTNTAAGAFTVGNLTAGTYTLAETKAPQGYVLNSTPMTVTVTAGGIASAGQIKNTAVTGNVEWSKVGDLGGDDLISGTSWTITPTDPAGAAITVTDNGTNDADSTFGKFLVKNLRYGTYTLKETAAPAGFELNETAYSFTISDDGKTVGVNDSKPIVDARTKGVVTWTKVDGSHNKLSGSEWTITPTGGGSPITVTDNTGQSGYTGADRDATTGAFEVDNLAWGDYTLTETKAPAGYKLDDSSHQFTISGTQLQVPVGEIVNEQQTPPSLPLTGGVGTDSFLIGGGALLALAGFGGFLRRRRTLRTARA